MLHKCLQNNIHQILLVGFFHLSFLLSQVNTETMRNNQNLKGFRHNLGFEFGYERSDQELLEISTQYRIDFSLPENLETFFILKYENGYEKESDYKNIINNKGFGHFRITKFFRSKLFLEFFLQSGFNDFLLINKRNLFGSGIRYNALNNEQFNFFIGSGLMRELEEYQLVLDDQRLLNRSTNYLQSKIKFSENIDLSNTVYYQMNVADFRDYRLLFDSDITFSLNEKLSFNFIINYRFDNEPHGDLRKSYIQINNGIEFNF